MTTLDRILRSEEATVAQEWSAEHSSARTVNARRDESPNKRTSCGHWQEVWGVYPQNWAVASLKWATGSFVLRRISAMERQRMCLEGCACLWMCGTGRTKIHAGHPDVEMRPCEINTPLNGSRDQIASTARQEPPPELDFSFKAIISTVCPFSLWGLIRRPLKQLGLLRVLS